MCRNCKTRSTFLCVRCWMAHSAHRRLWALPYTFNRFACTLQPILAGFCARLLRRFLFTLCHTAYPSKFFSVFSMGCLAGFSIFFFFFFFFFYFYTRSASFPVSSFTFNFPFVLWRGMNPCVRARACALCIVSLALHCSTVLFQVIGIEHSPPIGSRGQ